MYLCIHMPMYLCIFVSISMYVQGNAYVYVCVYVYVWVYVSVDIYIYIDVYMCRVKLLNQFAYTQLSFVS